MSFAYTLGVQARRACDALRLTDVPLSVAAVFAVSATMSVTAGVGLLLRIAPDDVRSAPVVALAPVQGPLAPLRPAFDEPLLARVAPPPRPARTEAPVTDLAAAPDATPAPAEAPVVLASALTSDDIEFVPAPPPRPAALVDDTADAPEAPATEVVAALPETGVLTSPRPTARPRDIAQIVARATRPAAPPTAPQAATVQVARADATEDILVPERSTPAPILRLGPAATGPNPCSSRLSREIPRRRGNMPDGTAFIGGLMNASGGTRDAAIVRAALQGNVPDSFRDLRPVRFQGMTAAGQAEITVCVTPDYLAIGSDRDSVRVPLGLAGALQVADAFDMILPTKRMVDAIYRQASVRVAPQPMPAGAQMSSTDYFLRHDRTVDAQLAQAGARDGLLVAGIKKDIVLTNRLGSAPGRVAIYGWHRTNGQAIQPLSTVHGASYADYSHGIRLVSRTAFLNGRSVDLSALLTNARYAGLLNDDGVLTSQTARVAQLR